MGPLEGVRVVDLSIGQMGPAATALVEDGQVIANDYVVELDDPRLGRLRVPGLAVQLSGSPGQLRPAPELGQHSEEVLRQLGYSWEEIGRLRESRTLL